MGKKEDLTGKKFSNLRVLLESYKRTRNGCVYWWCHCLLCDSIAPVSSNSLKTGHAKSCGCLQKEAAKKIGHKNKIDLVGQKFGHLTVLEDSGKRDKYRIPIWKCECDCKNHTIVYVVGNALKSGNKTSCGCLSSKGEEKIKQILIDNNIIFETQKTFEDCINSDTQRKLRFDFYLPDYNTCIEYDGEQHFYFQENSGWNTKENFIKQKNRDAIKQEYCKEHGIRVVHIPYWDYEKIDFNYLKKLL